MQHLLLLQGEEESEVSPPSFLLVCLQVLPGQYAFVLHTASPFSGERGEMYGELVCGLGETLVGNHPGRPLAFSDKPDGSDMQVRCWPVGVCIV